MHTFLAALLFLQPSPDWNETDWTRYIAMQRGIQAEVLLYDGSRADLIDDEYSWEADWCVGKWAEAIGQSVHYSNITGKKPKVLILTGKSDPALEKIHLLRCNGVCRRLGIEMEVYDIRKAIK